MKNTFFLIVALVLGLLSCKKNVNVYESCCGTQPLMTKVGNVSLYVPNAFTPNYDGINDFIWIFTSGTVGQISDFIIKNNKGVEVWRSTNPILPNDRFMTGTEQDKIPEGALTYTFKITQPNGTIVNLQGSVCKNSSKDVDCAGKNKGCFFGDQNDNGVLDKTIPNSESCK